MFLYFGCIRESGHYFFDTRGRQYYNEIYDQLPWKSVDGSLVPYKHCKNAPYEEEGLVALHHKEGWTALAFCDRSIDNRPGSNSVFLAQGIFSYQDMITLANKHFPDVIKRQRKPLELVWEDGVVPISRLPVEERARLYDEALLRIRGLEAQVEALKKDLHSSPTD